MLKNKIKELSGIEETFFVIDKNAGVARIELQFETPAELFDGNYLSKTPILSDDFMDWISSAFSLVSTDYKIDLTVKFEDMQGYTEEELRKIFSQNIGLEFKSKFMENRRNNRVAFSLIGIGILFFLAMLAISHLWNSDSVWKEIFVYISDIATTVTFWEAMTILVVQQREKRAYLKNLVNRFSEIRFIPAADAVQRMNNQVR